MWLFITIFLYRSEGPGVAQQEGRDGGLFVDRGFSHPAAGIPRLPAGAGHRRARRPPDFGSDQMVWPESITLAIEGVDRAAFLTPEQKRAIFHDNAARFLGLKMGDSPLVAD